VSTISRGTAIPYGVPTVVKDYVGGELKLFREQFDRESWQSLPERIPVVRGHAKNSPIGWGALDSTDRGLTVDIDYIDGSVAASDARAEVQSQVMTGLSISFRCDQDADVHEVDRHSPVPLTIHRRGAVLLEVSLVAHPAYDGARITAPSLDRWRVEESARILAPYAAARKARQAADQALMERALATVRAGEALSGRLRQQGQIPGGIAPPGAASAAGRTAGPGRGTEQRGYLVSWQGVRVRVPATTLDAAERQARSAIDEWRATAVRRTTGPLAEYLAMRGVELLASQ
jgi:HK97 family phage prohead protease